MIPISKPTILGKEKEYLTECIESGWISSAGKFIPQFEDMNAAQYQKKYGVAVSNGTVALHLALAALGIGQGDEVIVPDLTFAATINAVLYTGATPVLADIDEDSWTLSGRNCSDLITQKTKAIIPVHLYGQPADMDSIMELAKVHDLFVVEDCAEAHGASYKDQPIGSFGHISCFSFYGNKIITTGEGGICLTDEEGLNRTLRILRDHGMSADRKYWHDRVGYNYRMTNLQAAVGVAQMERFEEMLNEREIISNTYNELLSLNQNITLQSQLPSRTKVPWIYSILIDTRSVGNDIQNIQEGLRKKAIDSRPFFAPLSMMPIYNKYAKKHTRHAHAISSRGLSLPTYIGLREEDIESVCSSLNLLLEGTV